MWHENGSLEAPDALYSLSCISHKGFERKIDTAINKLCVFGRNEIGYEKVEIRLWNSCQETIKYKRLRACKRYRKETYSYDNESFSCIAF
jgi:hypothetical protein